MLAEESDVQIGDNLDPYLRVAQIVSRLDELLARQLDLIIHHPRFQELESAWRGLELMLREAPRARRSRIAVLDVSWRELRRDLERALDFDLSALFWQVYTTEFDMPGGEPFGVIICNFRVSHRNEADLRALRRIAEVAEAAFCSMLFPAAPELFGMDEFADFHPSIRPEKLFRAEEYRSWQLLRAQPACRFMAFLMPKVLMRRPWGELAQRRGRFPYSERCRQHGDYLWGHAGFALCSILLREFEETGWFSHVRGAPRDTLAGGLVCNLLPERQVDPCDQHLSVLPALELTVSDTLERELSDCGFISLSHCWQTSYSAFLSLPSLYRLKLSADHENAENERIGSQMQNVLCASRFAHYVKVIMRDKVGSFMTADACETFLLEWLQEYCAGGENLDWETRARYPLRKASVTVREKPMAPGYLLCNIALSPHYQYDGLVGEINLTTELARTPGAAQAGAQTTAP